jgi:drug/metabolite transporter (DMT)-like permease
LYLVSAKKLRAEVDVTVLMCGIFFVSVLLHFPVFSLLGTDFEFSRDPTIGLFGWLDASRFLSETYVVIVCTLVGTLGYVAVMKYFDPIVVSVVMLVEPTIANLMGVAAGVDALPGVLTVIGSLLVVAGTLLVIVSNSSHIDTINATAAMTATTTAAIPKALSSRSAAPTRKPHVL